GRDFEEAHRDSVDGILGDSVAQLLEVDLGVEGLAGIGNGAFGKSAEADVAGLCLPIAVDENGAVVRFLTKRLGNEFIEENVAVGNDRALQMALPRLEGLEQGIQLPGVREVVVIDIGEVG